ncbi:MAG TPA: hypothetical protein VEQ85_07825 [Lacipirellulaceae bacterium]|nr:hypothetical protein [Lacipirellulaceae bacterium]
MKHFLAIAALVLAAAPAEAYTFINDVNGLYVQSYAVENDPGTTLVITPEPVAGAISPLPQSATFAESGFTNTGGGFQVNNHRFTFSNDGGVSPAVYNFQHGAIGFDLSVDIKLTWEGPNTPRKEAGIIVRSGNGNGQFIVNSDREVAAFQNPFTFHNFNTEGIFYDEGDVMNLRVIYTPPVYDQAGTTVLSRGTIAYQVRENGGEAVTFGPEIITNLESGLFDNSTISLYQQAQGAVGSTTDGATTVFSNMIFRPAPKGADFDLDGDVDGNDFVTWQQGLGITTGATKQTGDANGDEAVTAADLDMWRMQFGPASVAAAAAVPEPSCGALLACAAAALAAHRRKR